MTLADLPMFFFLLGAYVLGMAGVVALFRFTDLDDEDER